jgi:peptidoglycan hydrolase-like protein with peptidoglycan-binding domain
MGVSGQVNDLYSNYLTQEFSTMTTINKPTLRLGSNGEDVKELQRLLNKYYYNLPVNGVFGVWTENSVKDFQFSRFLDVDGIVGNKTWRALYSGAPVDMPVLRRGSRDAKAVKIVQNILANLSKSHTDFVPYYTGIVDSVFGVGTEDAVKTFQMNSGLVADGIVGSRTWHALSKHSYVLYHLEEALAVH